MTHRFARVLAHSAAILLSVLAWSPLRAEPPEDKTVPPPTAIPIPDSPAGKALSKILDALGPDAANGAFSPDWFAESFLQQVPPAQLAAVHVQLRDSLGALSLLSIADGGGATSTHLVALCRGDKDAATVRLIINVDQAGLMDGLLFQPVADFNTPPLKSWDDFDAALRKIIGEGDAAKSRSVTFAAFELNDGKILPIHDFYPDSRLAIGSTFKLYILGAIAQHIAATPHDGPDPWEEQIEVREDLKSLPSGVMQNEKAGAKFPLSYFADKMISISDNSATDHLLAFAGRENVEKYMSEHSGHAKPDLNRPFLCTHELFVLKLGTDATLSDRYLAADTAARRAMLAPEGEITKSKPSTLKAGLWTKPYRIDTLEWFASARECCNLMADLHRLEQNPLCARLGRTLSINPGIPYDRAAWSRVAFKGGSEPGVFNLTYMLTRADGRMFLLSLGLNDTAAPISDAPIIGLMSRTFELIAGAP